MKDIRLTDVQVHNTDGCFSFDLTYTIRNENGSIYEVTYKDCSNPFPMYNIAKWEQEETSAIGHRFCDMNGSYRICTKDSYSKLYTQKQLREADPIELTIEDLEKEYGRPVKIISNKG